MFFFSITATKRFLFQIFLTDFGFALLVITFLIRNHYSLFSNVSSIDSSTTNFGNSLSFVSV